MLILSPKPSRWIRALLLTFHLIAAMSALHAGLNRPCLLLIWLMLTGNLILSWQKIGKSIQLRCHADGRLEVAQRMGVWKTAAVLQETLMMPMVVVLRYRLEGSKRSESCLILGDGLDSETFRRLRVWLAWQASSVVNESNSDDNVQMQEHTG